MKTAFAAVAAAGLVVIAAAFYCWSGDATEAAGPPKGAVRGGDTIAFVTGAEAEPPALPGGLPMPPPRKASRIAAAGAEIARRIARPAPVPVKKFALVKMQIPAATVTFVAPEPAPKPAPVRQKMRLND